MGISTATDTLPTDLRPTQPAAADRPASLMEVIDVIPADCYRRSTIRGLGLAARDLAVYGAAIAGLVIYNQWWQVLALWAAAAVAVSAMFVLGHDAAHEALFDNRRLNSWVAHVMFLPSLHIVAAWKLGHNHIHHRHTARQSMDFVWHPVTAAEYRDLNWLAKLRHRLEWSALGSGIYYGHRIWWAKMIRLRPPDRMAAEIKRDRRFLGAWAIAATAIAALAGGLADGNLDGALWMVVKVLVVPFMLFGWIIGWTVYVHHIGVNMPWTRRRDWNKVDAQLTKTSVLRAPRAVNVFFHHIFVHVPHHVDPRIPCYRLVEATAAIEAAFPNLIIDEKLRLRRYVSTTLRCKLFDFESGCWLTYRAARRALALAPAANG